MSCPTCGGLGGRASGQSKYGWPDYDVPLPSNIHTLETLAREGGGGRERKLLRCPTCRDHFLYWTDYEFLVNGSEDTEDLVRLDEAQTRRALAGDLGGLKAELSD